MSNIMMSHFVSVIVPVYNTEKYLDKCIQSILNQSFTDFELLLINDGSTDRSGAICDAYALQDERVRVFHKKNGGVSSTRNMGLDEAKGEWITFVDSDDWLKPDYLMNLYACVNEKVDLIIAYAENVMPTGEILTKEHSNGWVSDDNFSDLFSKYEMCQNTTCWAKLYKTSCIKNNKIRFNENISMGEDTVFLYNYLVHSLLIYISGQVDYCYRDTSNSLSKKFYLFSMEIEGYKQINHVITQMFAIKKIDDIIAAQNLKTLKAYYVWRILKCLYNPDAFIPVKQRLAVIKSLDFSVLEYIADGDTVKWTILKWFLRHKFFMIYDSMRFINTKLKTYAQKSYWIVFL